jgi:hypothetical protein
MAIWLEIHVQSDWFAQTGEIRRHAQLLIVNQCILDVTRRTRDNYNEKINARLANGIARQITIDHSLSKQSNCLIRYGIVDCRWPSMRIALSLHGSQEGKVVALFLFKLAFRGQGNLGERRAFKELALLPGMAWNEEDNADLEPLLRRVPLSIAQMADEKVHWTYLGREW